MSEADDILAIWRGRLGTISANTNDLAANESTKRIRIRARQGQYTGETKALAAEAVRQLDTLSDDYLLLANSVASAVEAARGFAVSRETRLERVNAILGPGAILRTLGAVPIERRAILESSVGAERISADELLARMDAEFAAARDALASIDQAEQANREAVASLKQDYERLDKLAGALNITSADRPSFIELQGLDSDPLGAAAGIDAMQRALAGWAALIEQSSKAKEQATIGIGRARAGLDDLWRQRDGFKAELAKFEASFGPDAVHTLTPVQDDSIKTLDSWLESLNKSLADGHWTAVNVGLSRFERALQDAAAAAQQSVSGVIARNEALEELRGRFVALKAKDMAIGTGAEGRKALRLAVGEALAAQPVDMRLLTERLKTYQAALSGMTH